MEGIRGNAALTYAETIFLKQGYSNIVSLRILAEDERVTSCYQEVKQHGTIQQGSSKVMIVGDHGVGKTSLCKHLMELPFQQNEISTKSVEMYDVETVKVDKNWKRIPDDCKEYERALNGCAAAEYQKLPESNGIKGCNDSKFKSAGQVMKVVSVTIPALFMYGGFPSNFAVLHMIYVAMFCLLYKDLSLSHGYRIGQAFAIFYFFIQNLGIHLGIMQSMQNFSRAEVLWALLIMSVYGYSIGILIGSGCRHGLALACALVFWPSNHMYSTSLPNIWHIYSTQRLIQVLTISIGTVAGGGVYHLKEYHFQVVNCMTIFSFVVFVTMYHSDNILHQLCLQLEVLKDFTTQNSMVFVRVLCGIIFSAFSLTGLINYGRKIVTYTDKIHHCPRVALGLICGILLAKFTGAYIYKFSYTQLVDIILAVLPTIIFEIHGFLQVYKHDLDMSELCRSLKRLERQEEIVPLHIHLIDFAGDKEYHTSHQAFFAKGATYIVVFNLENSICSMEMVLNSIKYWLNSILIYTGTGQPVFLVGTHRDKVNEEVVRYFQKWLSSELIKTPYYDKLTFIFPKDDLKQGTFFAIKNPVKLSKDAEACLLRNKISQLAISPLTEHKMKAKPMDSNIEPIKVPLSWLHLLDVARNLSSNGKHFIKKYELFNNLLEQDVQLTEKEFVQILRYFNDRGDIRFDDSCNSLKDVVVLNLQIFRDSIVALVSKSMEFQNDAKLQSKGIITSDLLDAAIKTDSKEERQVIKDLLEANDLILPLRTYNGKTDYMLSGFLPKFNESGDNLNPYMRLTKKIYYFDFERFLPEKVFLKLIVKCKENCQETAEHKDPSYPPIIYENAASFIQQCGKNEIPYNIKMVQKSISQNLIQICIDTDSDSHCYYMLENLNSWVRDILKQYKDEPQYHLGFPCVGDCKHEEGQLSSLRYGRNCLSSCNSSDYQELLSDSFLHELANKIGSDKFDLLGSKLGISYQRLREYSADFVGKPDIVRQCNLKLLHEWKENNEGTDKVQLVNELAKCLSECELIQLATDTEDLINN